MSNEAKLMVGSIVNFLKQQLDGAALDSDSRESVEVAVQCIETAFGLQGAESTRAVDLLQLMHARGGSQTAITASATTAAASSASPTTATASSASPTNASAAAPSATTAEAEQLKNEGNKLMKAERYHEALEQYSRAIKLDPRNSVYFCNRAAAHLKLGENEAAVADCTAALGLQPDYSKAHGRLGLAFTALDRHREARAAFVRAVELEPENEYYRQSLRLADGRLAADGELGGLLQNPALLNMAMEMLTDPNMQNLITGLVNMATAGD